MKRLPIRQMEFTTMSVSYTHLFGWTKGEDKVMTKDVFIKEVWDAEAMLYHISKSILKNDSDCGDEMCIRDRLRILPSSRTL